MPCPEGMERVKAYKTHDGKYVRSFCRKAFDRKNVNRMDFVNVPKMPVDSGTETSEVESEDAIEEI